MVASTCKDLQELRVVPLDPYGPGVVTKEGLIVISRACHKLTFVLYFCCQMTNATLITVAKNCMSE